MPRKNQKIIRENRNIVTNNGSIIYEYIRSSHRKTLVIYVDEDARVKVYAPFSLNEEKIREFISQKSDWITKKLREFQKHKKVKEKNDFSPGREYLFLGKKYPLLLDKSSHSMSRVHFDGRRFQVMVRLERNSQVSPRQDIRTAMIKWYRAQAEEYLGGRLFHYSRLIGVEPLKIAIRTQKRIWGNCDYRKKQIHLNWQIILSPPDVIDYIVVHELCHLVHPNHSKRFWKKVERFLPRYKLQKKWLNQNQLEMAIV